MIFLGESEIAASLLLVLSCGSFDCFTHSDDF